MVVPGGSDGSLPPGAILHGPDDTLPGGGKPPPTPPLPPMPPAGADHDLSRRLTELMVSGPEARCTAAADATAAVTREARPLGLGHPGYVSILPGYSPDAAPDGVTTCVRPSVNVGGSTLVHLDVVSVESFQQNR